MGRYRLAFGVLGISIVLTFAHFSHYLTGEWLIRHDSKVGLTIMHLFFDNLVRGHLPLWIPEQNAGEPLWHVAESVVVFEPIALTVWPLAYLLKVNSSIAYAWCCWGWLFVFALGAMLLSRKIVRDDLISLFVFAFIFGGPLALTMSSQSGFIFPFRYFPWVLLTLLNFFESPRLQNVFFLACAGGLSASSFQTGYSLVFLVPFAVALLFKYRTKLSRQIGFGLALSLLLTVLWVLPQIVACFGLLELVAMPREYGELHRFTLSSSEMLRGLIDYRFQMPSWHGSSFVGLIPLLVTVFALLMYWRKRFPWLCGICLMLFGMGYVLSTDWMGRYLEGHNTFFGLRNWGLVLPLLFLFWSVWIAWGLANITNRWVLAAVLIVFLGESIRSLNRETQPMVHQQARLMPPVVGSRDISLAVFREWTIEDYFDFVPFQHQAPALMRQHVAFMDPLISDVRFLEMYRLTQQIRLPRYHELVTSMISDEKLKVLLGVSVPTMRVLTNVKSVPDYRTAIAELERMPESEARLVALVEGNVGSLKNGRGGEVKVRQFSPNTAEFRVSSKGGTVFSWSDTYTSDWLAKVDGKPVPVLPVNGTGKGVLLDTGEHTVQFEYFPFWYVVTFWVRAVLFLVVLLATVYVWVSNNLTSVWGRVRHLAVSGPLGKVSPT